MVKEFNNGNINVKFDSDDIKKCNAAGNDNFWKAYEILGAYLDSVDCEYIADFYSVGNVHQAIDIFNHRTQKIFSIYDNEFYELIEGSTIKLIGRNATDEELEILDEIL